MQVLQGEEGGGRIIRTLQYNSLVASIYRFHSTEGDGLVPQGSVQDG